MVESVRPEGPEDVAEFMRRNFDTICGSLCVYADWFGKPRDNEHRLTAYENEEHYLKLCFDEGETLEVWEPVGLKMERRDFVIVHAFRVRWEWFFYGRAKVPENRFFIEHVAKEGHIDVITDATWVDRHFQPSLAKPAILFTPESS